LLYHVIFILNFQKNKPPQYLRELGASFWLTPSFP
jgi:hypothetical protein